MDLPDSPHVRAQYHHRLAAVPGRPSPTVIRGLPKSISVCSSSPTCVPVSDGTGQFPTQEACEAMCGSGSGSGGGGGTSCEDSILADLGVTFGGSYSAEVPYQKWWVIPLVTPGNYHITISGLNGGSNPDLVPGVQLLHQN